MKKHNARKKKVAAKKAKQATQNQMKWFSNPNAVKTPQDYLDREKNIMYEGEYKGIKYKITENDMIRKEISVQQDPNTLSWEIVTEILMKHYGRQESAGVAPWHDKFTYFPMPSFC